ncbi:MAG TPA: patatin family protein [Candidatus Faecousia intestinigallinarum]|nr:patatin family protein [Candidatus Faecousia intestinigallinarum]
MKTGLVLEGGGSRGVFTSGVLDVFLERGLTFDYCAGVSAGAGNAMNFKSRQAGRAWTILGGTDPRVYYGMSQARKSGRLLNLDYLYDTMSYEGAFPFDFHAYYENPMVCEYVLTCCETGQAAYFQETVYQKRLIDIIKASCSLPGLCSPVRLGEEHYLDGGIADAMPVFRALNQGCEKVVLITTKPAENLQPTDYSRQRTLLRQLYKGKYPAFYAALMTRSKRYFAQLDEILELEKEGQILVIRPQICPVRTLEKDAEQLGVYYRHGRQTAEESWPALEAYLGK